MQSGFLRCSKYLSRWFLIVIAQVVLLISIFFLYTWLLHSTISDWIVPIMVTFAPLIMSVQLYTILYKNTIGFSVSRQNFFGATYVAKGIFSTFSLIIVLVFMSMSSFDVSPMLFVNIFFVCIAFGVLGDFFGLLMHRFSTIGLVIYIIACSVCSGFIGASAAMSDGTFLWEFLRNPLVLVIALVMCGGVSLINWMLIQKFEIKG